MALTDRPAACRAVMADSRPEPGPLTRTSISFRPNLAARSAQVSAARWAAKGVLLRLPLKPTVPADAKHRGSPLVSVMVTIVLLKVALMWAMPRLTLRRALRFLLLATNPPHFSGRNHEIHERHEIRQKKRSEDILRLTSLLEVTFLSF